MRDPGFHERVRGTLDGLEAEGLTRPERILASPQGSRLRLRVGARWQDNVLNLCANDYLGLASDPRVVEAARAATAEAGAGFASVRFICGTHDLHKALEAAVADYLGYEDAILFAAAFDANGGVFEPLFDAQDAIVSDSLNHASIIDGIRLCKAARYPFANGDMADLERQLIAARASGARTVLIATDGVFSMDGYFADLPRMTALAEQHDALLMVDDCHATGIVGPGGCGTAAHFGVKNAPDILTGTFGKALGGAMGGFVAARGEIISLLRQRARPYLFSNALPPGTCGAALEGIRIARGMEGDRLRARLNASAAWFRNRLIEEGFRLNDGSHPIIPVLLQDARLARDLSAALLDEGLLAPSFAFPVVPRNAARIRTQISAAHSAADLEFAVDAFVRARATCGGA